MTSPVAGPEGEKPHRNYAFDYGSVHFATFESNCFYNEVRLTRQLDWLAADMAASDAAWKIVFAHHPWPEPDKPRVPADVYYRQVVERLNEAGVDLLLVGHLHLYHRTYPLLGERAARRSTSAMTTMTTPRPVVWFR